MEQFDDVLRSMAKKEEIMMPDGFEERMRDTLDSLPPKAKKRRGLGAAKTALIAVAACAALLGTAFAASPGLREMLAEALGGFAPYAQEQDSEVYTWNGFEFKALSAMADEITVRAYIQVTDLEGRDRLDIHGETWQKEFPFIELGGLKSDVDITGGGGGSGVRQYDAATQTAIVEVSAWTRISKDLSGAEVRIDTVENMMDDSRNAAVVIPLDVKVMPSRTVLRDIDVGEVPMEEVGISALSMTLKWEKIYDYISQSESDLGSIKMAVKMMDGTVIETEHNYPSHHISYFNAQGRHTNALIWCFADPVDVDNIEGVYIGEDYFPIR